MLQRGRTAQQRSFPLILWTIMFLIILMSLGLLKTKFQIKIQYEVLQNFSTVFLSIILETIPFILLGAFVSSLIQVFISEQLIARLIPKNRFVGLVAASLMGFIFPVCECAIIPIARRLLKKGVPTGIVVTFMLAVPIVNPVVLLSTYYAFISKPVMVFVRGGLGFVSAILIGFIIGLFEEGRNPLRGSRSISDFHRHDCDCGHHQEHAHGHDDEHVHEHNHSHNHNHNHNHNHHSLVKHTIHKPKIMEIIDHTSLEFYDIGKYLIFGSLISAAFQTLVSRSIIMPVGFDKNISVLVMIIFAFVISLCSEADAFVARSFMGQFTTGSIAAFLIFGPMLDIKNTLMLNAVFKKRFIFQLMLLIFFVCFAAGIIVNSVGI